MVVVKLICWIVALFLVAGVLWLMIRAEVEYRSVRSANRRNQIH